MNRMAPLTFENEFESDLTRLSTLEWLETDGLGGWASSTVCGLNTRKYHGLLVCALKSPADRYVLLSRLDETVVTQDERYELACRGYTDIVVPDGRSFLKSFNKDFNPEWHYQCGDLVLKKHILAEHGENTIHIVYELSEGASSVTLELRPFLAARHYHLLCRQTSEMSGEVYYDGEQALLDTREGLPKVHMVLAKAEFRPEKDWYFNFDYPEERARGYPATEDLLTPGVFSIQLRKGKALIVSISSADLKKKKASSAISAELKRRKTLLKNLKKNDELSETLALAADQFIVKRSTGHTVIAGYHWFTDWGRDTMISLPGLCLVTKRYVEARGILDTFANYIDGGLIPNRFPDGEVAPEYNAIDATLWFFVAVYQYFRYTKDSAFVFTEMLPRLEDCIDAMIRGTHHQIKVDTDGLLRGGEPGVQLTWMDAKVGSRVITPRIGKPVEVNALWYNALMITGDLLRQAGKSERAGKYESLAQTAKASFTIAFWNAEKGYCYDCVDRDFRDDSVRPNQLLALSLPFPLLNDEQAAQIVGIVETHLLVRGGVRSLDFADPQYQGHYGGVTEQRDEAYHQGTAWTWLLGPLLTALVRYGGERGKRTIERILDDVHESLCSSCIGSLAELVDGDAPHDARGCVAQAWSVAELLRAYVEDICENMPRKK